MRADHYQKATTTAGIGGPGFLMFAKYMEWQLPGWFVVAIGIGSCCLLLYSGIIYVQGVWGWVRRALDARPQIRDAARRKLIPYMIGAAVLASFTLLAVSAGFAVMYRNGAFNPVAPPIVINTPPNVAPSPASHTAPVKLLPNAIPDVPDEMARRVGRYWQLKDAIPQSENLHKIIEQTGTFYRDKMNPKKNLTSVGWVSRWQNALTALQKLNESIYKNRPLDLESAAPEMAYPTARAPHEDDFNPEDAAAIYKYRSFHFLLKNILAQSDSLTDDMKKEAASIRAETIKSIPAERLEE